MINYLIAFVSGSLGTMIGGTASFVITGLVGLIVIILDGLGANTHLLTNQVLNLLFMPCVCFNGAVAGLAYAANVKHYDINGADGNRSLYFTGDPLVLIIGGIFGLLGYGLFSLFTYWNFPIDIGALVVLSLNMLIRVLFGTNKYIHHPSQPLFSYKQANYWCFQIIFAAVLSLITAYFVGITGVASLGFSLSALSLVFAFSTPDFPATHHTTLIAGYAMVATNSLAISTIFGVLAQLFFIVFNTYFNTDLDSHVDAPAASIALFSLLIFTLF
ncbi:hypothetical protein B5F09_01400 [Erysipelatoclostridium sp. An173]|uniref:hypothetical protein n=1 Tax=Erysipelatoclostridium sp. An173 TaxID=1965571 RepID=UPI000B3A1585|nr:hypothetical protein [Erysipelatoclostridium sp. An173]OUP78838.1 hypothetical protein B5F09_01400 [Erysipelatoclostridium sp. An173]